MNSEDWQQQRQLCIAQMAATLYAGALIAAETHNASPRTSYEELWRDPNPMQIAKDASQLFDAVDNHEAALVEAKYDVINARDR